MWVIWRSWKFSVLMSRLQGLIMGWGGPVFPPVCKGELWAVRRWRMWVTSLESVSWYHHHCNIIVLREALVILESNRRELSAKPLIWSPKQDQVQGFSQNIYKLTQQVLHFPLYRVICDWVRMRQQVTFLPSDFINWLEIQTYNFYEIVVNKSGLDSVIVWVDKRVWACVRSPAGMWSGVKSSLPVVPLLSIKCLGIYTMVLSHDLLCPKICLNILMKSLGEGV